MRRFAVVDSCFDYESAKRVQPDQNIDTHDVLDAVLDTPQIDVALSPAQIYPAPTSTASGAASITVDLATGATSGKVQGWITAGASSRALPAPPPVPPGL